MEDIGQFNSQLIHKVIRIYGHTLNVVCTWQQPHTHFSVAPNTMHMGTNQKAQQLCGSGTNRSEVALLGLVEISRSLLGTQRY